MEYLMLILAPPITCICDILAKVNYIARVDASLLYFQSDISVIRLIN